MDKVSNFVFFTLTLLNVFLLNLWLSNLASELKFSPKKRSALIKGLVGLLSAWLILIAGLSVAGIFSTQGIQFPILILVPVTALFSVLLIHRALISERVLSATPMHWAVKLQTFRIGVELALLGLYLSGKAPIQVTFEGRNFDILVGLTAPLVAYGIAKNKLGPRPVIAWNIAGLLILGNTIFTVITSVPSPIYHDWAGGPFMELKEWPTIWLPAFLAPLAIGLHIFSIRQNIKSLRE